MVNFGPLMAKICWQVWGIPANFNGFCVLAALLHGILVVGVSQTLQCWTEGATYIQQRGHHVGHWPHSSFMYTVIHKELEMWANAQCDGRPVEYSWHCLFNAAKFGWRPLLECRAVTLPRRETHWNLQGCLKLANRSQPLVGQSSPYCEDMWGRHCCLTVFSNCRYVP